MQAGAMEYNPQICGRNIQYLTDFFTTETIDFSQHKRMSQAGRKFGETMPEHLPDFLVLQDNARIATPVCGCNSPIPLRSKIPLFWLFVTTATKVVTDLMLENADQPGSFRGAACKLLVILESSKKRVLHYILSQMRILEPENRITK
jgi:hypothetical protein